MCERESKKTTQNSRARAALQGPVTSLCEEEEEEIFQVLFLFNRLCPIRLIFARVYIFG